MVVEVELQQSARVSHVVLNLFITRVKQDAYLNYTSNTRLIRASVYDYVPRHIWPEDFAATDLFVLLNYLMEDMEHINHVANLKSLPWNTLLEKLPGRGGRIPLNSFCYIYFLCDKKKRL